MSFFGLHDPDQRLRSTQWPPLYDRTPLPLCWASESGWCNAAGSWLQTADLLPLQTIFLPLKRPEKPLLLFLIINQPWASLPPRQSKPCFSSPAVPPFWCCLWYHQELLFSTLVLLNQPIRYLWEHIGARKEYLNYENKVVILWAKSNIARKSWQIKSYYVNSHNIIGTKLYKK